MDGFEELAEGHYNITSVEPLKYEATSPFSHKKVDCPFFCEKVDGQFSHKKVNSPSIHLNRDSGIFAKIGKDLVFRIKPDLDIVISSESSKVIIRKWVDSYYYIVLREQNNVIPNLQDIICEITLLKTKPFDEFLRYLISILAKI